MAHRFILLEKDRLPDSCKHILQIHFGEEIANSTSAAMFIELSMIVTALGLPHIAAVCIELSKIVTELGLPYIIRSDKGPCYNSKEFQQFLQCYSITHYTNSPNHPRSKRFVERMV